VFLRELAGTSEQVAATPARSAKIRLISDLLSRASLAEVPLVVAFLSGELRQRQIGVGYAALSGLWGPPRREPSSGEPPEGEPPAAQPLTVTETDAVFTAVGEVSGPGAQAARKRLLAGLFARADGAEREFLARLLSGELHQGALEGVMIEAVAQAAGVRATGIRRAHLLTGSLPLVAETVLAAGGPQAAQAALDRLGLRVGRPLRPMLASTAPTVATALARLTVASHGSGAPQKAPGPPSPQVALEWKIDGIRIQVHRDGATAAVFTRTLDDITARVPEITEAVLALDARAVVADGEAVALDRAGRPRPFQVTASRAGSQAGIARLRAEVPLTPFFFDLLHLDGTDLVDEPASRRFELLSRVVPGELIIPRLVTGDPQQAERFFAAAVGRGHEGVVVKSLRGRYAAGRRGSEWIKVKPRHTLDLVVLAAEWGHGRRRGWLSNLHLGARDPAGGGLVMLGKTFKGLTDQMLAWQTARLLELADPPGSRPAGDLREARGVLRVRPELVVEVAFDGVQASPRYPGGVALRFARVLRHRPDKPAAEADTIDAVRAVWPGAAGPPPG
jgi:ATP-dependent DNA ligase I